MWKNARISRNLSFDITLGKKGVAVTGLIVQYSDTSIWETSPIAIINAKNFLISKVVVSFHLWKLDFSLSDMLLKNCFAYLFDYENISKETVSFKKVQKSL